MTIDMHDTLHNIVLDDVKVLTEKDKSYGGSWKKRGGIGAFMMLARKWDRIEVAIANHDCDILKAMLADRRTESLLDDVQDLRRYLLLVTEHRTERTWLDIGTTDRDIIQDESDLWQHWQRWGGSGMALSLSSEWSTLEALCKAVGYDVFYENEFMKFTIGRLRRHLYRLEYSYLCAVDHAPSHAIDNTGMDSPFGFNAAEEVQDEPQESSKRAEGT